MADAVKEIEIEADGFITRMEDLERVSASRAVFSTDCLYPKCEKCENYHGNYCAVPMVISKQNYRLTQDLLAQMGKRLTELENLVTDEICGSKQTMQVAPTTFSWNDYFGEDK